jgi:hypothetical protein
LLRDETTDNNPAATAKPSEKNEETSKKLEAVVNSARPLIENKKQEVKLLKIIYAPFILPIVLVILLWVSIIIYSYNSISSNLSNMKLIAHEMNYIALKIPYANLLFHLLLKIIINKDFMVNNDSAINFFSATISNMYKNEETFQSAFTIAKGFHSAEYISLFNDIIFGNLCTGQLENDTECSSFDDQILTKGLFTATIKFYDTINSIFKSQITNPQPKENYIYSTALVNARILQSHYMPLLYEILESHLTQDISSKHFI